MILNVPLHVPALQFSNLHGSSAFFKLFCRCILTPSLLSPSPAPTSNTPSWLFHLTCQKLPSLVFWQAYFLHVYPIHPTPYWHNMWLSSLGQLESGQLINKRNVFVIGLEAGSPRSGSQHGQVRALLQVAEFSLYPYVMEGARRHYQPCL